MAKKESTIKRLLDLYCGVGGASSGYADAGWEIVGVDHNEQPDYPFEFVQDDAIDVLDGLFLGLPVAGYHLYDFDAIHASPPCQKHSSLTRGTNQGREYVDLVPRTRAGLIRASGKSHEDGKQVLTIMENVVGAGLRPDVVLCGEMFGLSVIRHRVFEASFPITGPAHIKHRGRVKGWRHGEIHHGPYISVYGRGGYKGTIQEWKDAMGIQWTEDRKSLAEAIPPAYSEWLGRRMNEYLATSHISDVLQDEQNEGER